MRNNKLALCHDPEPSGSRQGAFLIIFIYRIGTFNGVPLRQYVHELFRVMIDPYATEKPYQMIEGDRLFLNQNKK